MHTLFSNRSVQHGETRQFQEHEHFVITATYRQLRNTVQLLNEKNCVLLIIDTCTFGGLHGSIPERLLFITYMNDINNVSQLRLTILYEDGTNVLLSDPDFRNLPIK